MSTTIAAQSGCDDLDVMQAKMEAADAVSAPSHLPCNLHTQFMVNGGGCCLFAASGTVVDGQEAA